MPVRGLARPGCAVLWAWLALASLGCNLISADRSDGPNVLLVTIDTLRADRVGAYGARDVATRAGGLVPTGLLRALNAIWQPLSVPLGVVEPSLGQLCLGLIEPDRIPEDRLGPGRTPLPGGCP